MDTIEWSNDDLRQMEEKGIAKTAVEAQLASFQKGFPYLSILKSADLESGITALSEKDKNEALEAWEKELLDPSRKVLKFVPASGAASRMFKELYQYLGGEDPSKKVEEFLAHLSDFAFYDALNRATMLGEGGKTIAKLLDKGEGRTVVKYLLEEAGLNYGHLPKALILFHKDTPNPPRTAMEEHLAEGALYARGADGRVHLHFTLSPEHIKPFETLFLKRKEMLEDHYNVSYDVTYSVQKPSTDTIAVNPDNTPFRNADGSLLFRPGGHGALIANLNEVDADIIFIKNIDNVVPDFLKSDTIIYKKVLGGHLVRLRDKVYHYMSLLTQSGVPSAALIDEIRKFLLESFSVRVDVPDAGSENEALKDRDALEELKLEESRNSISKTLRQLLNRPIRVCGMVRNEGEPGGGPYIIRDKSGISSLQILESTQIDLSNEHAKEAFEHSSYFNPVDLVVCTKDYRGQKFDLPLFVNEETGFISSKSKDGKELKALELPGLWNGAMSNWNTAFIEVPADTFNPVKTVNDLLRPAHRLP